jgi:hypothetical protein
VGYEKHVLYTTVDRPYNKTVRDQILRGHHARPDRDGLDVSQHGAIPLGQRQITPVSRQAEHVLRIATQELTESLSVKRRSVGAAVQR